jgi:hypothetical protein
MFGILLLQDCKAKAIAAGPPLRKKGESAGGPIASGEKREEEEGEIQGAVAAKYLCIDGWEVEGWVEPDKRD